MTTTFIRGYMEDDYLTEEYMSGEAMESTGFQVEMFFQHKTGMQVTMLQREDTGFQCTLVIYNNIQLRILMDFPSRGTEDLLGDNWTASSEHGAEDFDVKNLNTDIVEQYYRTADGDPDTTLTCDTGLVQGVAVDTIAILNHNLTTSAQVQVQGSKDGTFGPPDITFNMTVTRLNMFYIAPELPTLDGQNRYWRFIIVDSENPDDFIRIGTIVFGASRIFSLKECYVQPMKRKRNHYADKLKTEGYTAITNDKTLKRKLTLAFESLNRKLQNYRILDELFDTARTSLKCLIIPTPRFPERHTVFAKLTDLPEESIECNDDDGEEELITLDCEWDEAE